MKTSLQKKQPPSELPLLRSFVMKTDATAATTLVSLVAARFAVAPCIPSYFTETFKCCHSSCFTRTFKSKRMRAVMRPKMILIENAKHWAGEGEERDLSIDILAMRLPGKVHAVFVELFIGTGSSSLNHISVLTLTFKLGCNSAGLTRTPALCRNSSWHRSFPREVCFRILRLCPVPACSHCQNVCLFVLYHQRCI